MSFFNGNQMKILRKKLQLNQEEMGEKLGIKKSYVSQLENNRKEITEEIDQILQELEQEYQDKMNSLSVKNKEYMEDFVNREIVDKERRKQLIEDINEENWKNSEKSHDYADTFLSAGIITV